MEEWDSVQNILSDSVFLKEKEYCEAMMKKTLGTAEHDEWENRLGEVETAHQLLETGVQVGTLTPEAYMMNVRAALKRDFVIAQVGVCVRV